MEEGTNTQTDTQTDRQTDRHSRESAFASSGQVDLRKKEIDSFIWLLRPFQT